MITNLQSVVDEWASSLFRVFNSVHNFITWFNVSMYVSLPKERTMLTWLEHILDGLYVIYSTLVPIYNQLHIMFDSVNPLCEKHITREILWWCCHWKNHVNRSSELTLSSTDNPNRCWIGNILVGWHLIWLWLWLFL